MSFIKKTAIEFIYGLEAWHYKLLRAGSRIAYRQRVKKHLLKNVDPSCLTKAEEKEIKAYWRQYTKDFDIAYHRYYAGISGKADPRYIPDDLHICYIDPHFNNREKHIGVCDKNYFDIWFENAVRPKTICRMINGILYDGDYRLIDKTAMIELLFNAKEFVIKPSLDTMGGDNIRFIKNKDKPQIEKELDELPGKDIIFQEVVRQHEELNRIHKDSVNTLRIMTLLFKGEVHVVQSILRMGVGSARVDNALAGGIYCGIAPDGSLKKPAYDFYGKRYDRHPQGFEFDGFVIPGYQAACEMVVREAEKMANFRLISWDIAINEKAEPVLVEANLQAGGVGVLQAVNGPLFGELTDEVLAEVFGK